MQHKKPVKKRKASNKSSNDNRLLSLPKNSHMRILSEIVDLFRPYLSDPFASEVERSLRSNSIEAICGSEDKYPPQSISGTYEVAVHEKCASYLVSSFLSKYNPTDRPSHLRDRAFCSVYEGELACSRFNMKGRRSVNTNHRIFRRIKDIISQILGDLNMEVLLGSSCRHGPGSSTTCSYRNTSPYFKYGGWPYTITSRSVTHAKDLISSDQRWISYLEDSYRKRYDIPCYKILNWPVFWERMFLIDDWNKVTTVPKNYLKDRPIAIEHSLNIMLQLGVDGYIRKRLRRWGINLNSQYLNQVLARLGTVSDDIFRPATIDLANASDTVSLGVVKLLFPDEWYTYLCDLRSIGGNLPNGKIRYSKLSSMGNGYTFAVESLIFFAIALAVSEDYFGDRNRGSFPISVFGDDIVVAEVVSDNLIYWLEHLGFSVNTGKSFTSGPFKESCGCDFYLGADVRPVFLRKELRTLTDIYSIRNRLRRFFSLNFPEIDFTPLDNLFLGWLRGAVDYGPVSDNEFDTYWHIDKPPSGCFSGTGTYTFTAVMAMASKSAGKDFFLRNLMHPLTKANVHQWDTTASTGNRFDVVDRSKLRYRRGRRRCSDWNNAYSRPLASQ